MLGLQDVYIDFGCRIRSTWQRYVAQHSDLPDAAAALRILVNWMHGSGHDVACQLKNSGRYADESGWRVGEEIEQLWSIGKVGKGDLSHALELRHPLTHEPLVQPIGPLVRYMTPAHRRDFIEALLELVTRDKHKRIVRWLVKKYKDVKSRLSKL